MINSNVNSKGVLKRELKRLLRTQTVNLNVNSNGELKRELKRELKVINSNVNSKGCGCEGD